MHYYLVETTQDSLVVQHSSFEEAEAEAERNHGVNLVTVEPITPEDALVIFNLNRQELGCAPLERLPH